MATRPRVGALALAVVALALTVTGVVIASTNNPLGSTKGDPLDLRGYPPKSVDLDLALSAGDGTTLSANVNVDFVAGRIDAVAHFPVVITTLAVELRDVDNTLYLRSADASSGPWLDTPEKLPALFGISLEFVQPSADLALVTGYHETKTEHGDQTTYRLWRSKAVVTSATGDTGTTELADVHASITVGKGGEFQFGSLRVTANHHTTSLDVTVLSYNASPPIARPAASDVHPLKSATFDELFKNETFKSILLPLRIFSSGSSSVS